MRIVVLYGTEPMLHREYFDQLRHALSDAHGPVEPVVFDGKTVALAEVLDELRTQSLLQTYRLVVVDEAAEFVKTHRQAMERYAEKPIEDATLVLRSLTWRKGNLDKLIAAVGVMVPCQPLSEPAARSWLAERARAVHNCRVSAQALDALVAKIGPDLMRLDSELGKLAATSAGEPIDVEMVQALVGRSSDEQAWAVQEAILGAMASAAPGFLAKPSMGPAISKIHELVELAGQPDVLVTYFVADLFRKLYLAAAMRGAGTAPAQIGRALRLWGPRQDLLFRALARLRPGAVGRLFDVIIDADRHAKSGLGQPLTNLEGFLAQVADEVA